MICMMCIMLLVQWPFSDCRMSLLNVTASFDNRSEHGFASSGFHSGQGTVMIRNTV